MAQRRMFSLIVTDADPFLEMPTSAQALYFHLNMHADDDGFVGNARAIMRMAGCSPDDFKLLLAKQFLLEFESGVIVIRDWRVHNAIRKDRYKPTAYQDEFKRLAIASNGSYTLTNPVAPELPQTGNQAATTGKPNGNQMAPQVRLGKVRLGKDRSGSGSDSETCPKEPTTTTSSDPLKPVQQFWESNGFGSMTQYLWQDFEKWLADFKKLGATQENAVALIIKALQSCVEAGPDKRNQRYMRGILNRYANSRYTSVADVEADEKARKDAQQATSKRSGKPRNKPYTNDVWKDVVTGDPFADDDDYSQPVRKTSKRDAYHDHRLDDDFHKAEELAASNGSQGPTDPFSDSLPY